MKLFKPEVYRKFDEKIRIYNSVYDAINSLYEDEKLLNLFHETGKRYGQDHNSAFTRTSILLLNGNEMYLGSQGVYVLPCSLCARNLDLRLGQQDHEFRISKIEKNFFVNFLEDGDSCTKPLISYIKPNVTGKNILDNLGESLEWLLKEEE